MQLILRVVLTALCVVSGGEGRAVLQNNRYTDFVVAISPDVPQDDAIIDNIKNMMNDASRELYKATKNRAFFSNVKILLPKTWSRNDSKPIVSESFETAEFRVDKANAVYGDSPYTLQTTECGVPGTYTHITPDYVKDGRQWGNKGKTLVHEFAKLRWGVFEEHGYPGDTKFPMFYLKPVWTMDGQKTVPTPNFCVNKELRGYEQDIKTGGTCKKDPSGSGMPDGNCVFYPSQESAVTSSIMSIPYLSTNTNFCDSEEDFFHIPDLPNKQNLYCDGKSTWDIIIQSQDFLNGANPPNITITNTDPEFTILGGGSSKMAYVLVMDISLSMMNITAQLDRFTPMKNAAKRWISYDVEDGTLIGLLFFSDITYVGFGLTPVNEANIKTMINAIDNVQLKTVTCISCGLFDAINNELFLNKTEGNVIILLTDGKQQCQGECPSLEDARDYLVSKKTRVITMAIGNEADPEIEDLALRTGGKSYYIEDNSGPGDFNDAFSGSTTLQPGDTLGDTSVTVYQMNWMNITGNPTETLIIKSTFEIDTSLGRELTFRLEITNSKDNCEQNINITLYNPKSSSRIDEVFRCSKENFGIFSKRLNDLAETGTWQYSLKINEVLKSLYVKVTSKSKDESTDPIQTRCWINTGSQEPGEGINLKLSAMAEVKQGNIPVIGAKVSAYIERPQENGDLLPPLTLELLDNGSGSDSIANDGIYTRYFTKYTGTGRYSVKCQVEGSDDTNLNEGFVSSRKIHGKAFPEIAGTPLCCGSDALTPNSRLQPTGNFTRQSPGGSFLMTTPITGDIIPPMRVLDLKATIFCENSFQLQFTAPGDDLDSTEPAESYSIRFALTPGNLTKDSFLTGNNTELDASYILVGDLVPQEGSSTVTLLLNSTMFSTEYLYFFAMTARDMAGNESPVSNIASIGHPRELPESSNSPQQSAAMALMTVIFYLTIFN